MYTHVFFKVSVSDFNIVKCTYYFTLTISARLSFACFTSSQRKHKHALNSYSLLY